ncbi:MFS transporter [Streptosporangium sandarakinum]|uniref:MFS family permease n=1 Tax=Streptosporangium sandarakinum TaxID=1260955 RepID=A0A852UVU3_9ACTN|nr:MFS transporter [Streptosporangium sandarakinum]NYF39678.1 MFS family permease [Streptosporangium sandarakinum]
MTRQVGVAQAALGFSVNSLGACLVLLAGDLGTPPENLAWLASSFGAGLLAVGAAGSMLLRSGSRPALFAAALVTAAGAVLLATGAAAAVAAAGALLLGLGAAGIVLVTPALLRGPGAAAGLARANAVGSVSAMLGPPAIGALETAGADGRLALLLAVPPLLFLAADTRPRAASPVDAEGSTPAPFSVVDRPGDTSPAGEDRSGDTSPAGKDPSGAPAPAADAGTRGRTRRTAGAWAAIVAAVSIEFCFTIWATARLRDTGLSDGGSAAAATAFLVGMAAGRLAAARLVGRGFPVIPVGCGLAAAGTLLVALPGAPAPVAAGLTLAGLGVAPLYPVTLARLVGVPGLTAARSAAYGALASGTAILAAPTGIAVLGAALELRAALLIAVLPLAAGLAAATALPPLLARSRT